MATSLVVLSGVNGWQHCGQAPRMTASTICGSVTKVRTSALTGTRSGPSACHSIRCNSEGFLTPGIAAASTVPRHALRLGEAGTGFAEGAQAGAVACELSAGVQPAVVVQQVALAWGEEQPELVAGDHLTEGGEMGGGQWAPAGEFVLP